VLIISNLRFLAFGLKPGRVFNDALGPCDWAGNEHGSWDTPMTLSILTAGNGCGIILVLNVLTLEPGNERLMLLAML
jgi:hypothetical protein